jgi:hypothetical protein
MNLLCQILVNNSLSEQKFRGKRENPNVIMKVFQKINALPNRDQKKIFSNTLKWTHVMMVEKN